MIKNWKITLAFILGSVIAGLIAGNIKLDNQNIGGLLGSTISTLLILYLLPLIIAHLFKLLHKLGKKDLKGNEFVATYAVAWGILVFLILSGSHSNKQNNLTKDGDSGYLYNPKDSKYSVVFSRKPTITPTTVPAGSYFLKGEVAEIDLPNYGTFERVEFYILNKSFLKLLDNEVISKFLNEYSQYNGLTHPEIKFIGNDNNKFAELRAYKEATLNNGQKKTLTFVARIFIREETFFVTYVGADSKDFPSTDIINFWNSIKVQI